MDALKLHPLADKEKPWIVAEVKLPHAEKPLTFYSVVNEMTGDRITGLGNAPPMIGYDVPEVRRMVARMRKAGHVIREIHSKQFSAKARD